MPTTGFVLPTTRTVDAGSGTWTNDVNILASDGSEATFSLTSKNTDGSQLRAQNFGLGSAIPVGATIDQVQIRMNYRVNSTAGVADPRIQAYVSGASVGAIRSGSPSEPTTLTINDFDITADRSWTRADLLDGTFEILIWGRNGASTSDPSYRWDYVAVDVTYTEAPSGNNFTVTINDNLGLTDTGIVKFFDGTRLDSLGLTDQITYQVLILVERTNNDSINLTDTTTIVVTYDRPITNALGLTDTTVSVAAYDRSITNNLNLTDQVDDTLTVGDPNITKNDNLALTDSGVSRAISILAEKENVGLTDSGVTGSVSANFDDDNLVLRDSIVITYLDASTKIVSDNLGTTDAITYVANYVRTINDTCGIDDSGGFTDTEDSIDDNLGPTDTVVSEKSSVTLFAEVAGLTDSIVSEVAAPKILTYELGLTDSINVTISAAGTYTINENFTINDDTSTVADYNRIFSNDLNLSDTIILVKSRDFAELLGLSDVLDIAFVPTEMIVDVTIIEHYDRENNILTPDQQTVVSAEPDTATITAVVNNAITVHLRR